MRKKEVQSVEEMIEKDFTIFYDYRLDDNDRDSYMKIEDFEMFEGQVNILTILNVR